MGIVSSRPSFAREWLAVRQQRSGRVPGRPVPFVAPLPGDRGQCLEDDPVPERRGDVGVVVRRADLDHVHPHDRQLEADPAHGVEQLARRQPTRLGRARPGCMTGVADVDVDGEEDAVAVVHGDHERLGQALRQAAVHDLGHLVGPHLLAGHPVQRLGRRPVAAQPDLQEAVASQRARLDEPSHRLSVAPQRAELDVAGVRVRVEVDHRDPAVAEHVRDALRVGEGDGVVATEDDRDGSRTGHLLDRGLEAGSATSMSPEYISTSPASTTARSTSPSVRSARLGREPSCPR